MYSRPKPRSMPIDQGRRLLLRGAACVPLATAAGCGGGSSFPMGSMGMGGPVGPIVSSVTEHSLPILPLDTGVLDPSGTRQFALRVQRGTTQFRDGVDTPTLGYNGALLGPALRLRAGEATRIRVLNDLDEATTVHWHGLVVPADVDGGPHQPIAPGASWEARFTVANPPSTCWFHPHGHGVTGRQVLSGLAGLVIVDDPTVDPGALPRTWGVDDLALVLQDKRFTPSGQIDTRLSADDRLSGYSGETLLVNGVTGAVWQAPRQWVRLRLLNGCNARTLSVRLGNAAALLQVANEGGRLAQAVARSSIALAPGERAEVLVDLGSVASGAEVALLARSVDTGMGMGMGMGMGGASGESEVTALKMRVSLPRQADAIAAPPSALIAAPAIVAAAGATSRSFTLEGGMMGDLFTINGRSFDIRRIDVTLPAHTVEVWRFFNATMMAHPIHVHGVRMSLLTRDGAAPALHERGLRDTFVVEPMQTVAVAVQTPAQASSTPLMFHCHILEHEDAGMMGQFVAV